MNRVRIQFLVYGGGSLGAFYPYAISQTNPNIDFTVVCRSNYEVVRKRGYYITSKALGDGTFIPKKVIQSLDELLDDSTGKSTVQFDYILVTTKALDPTKVEIPRWVATPGFTSIIVLQNGIGVEEVYSKVFPENTIISAITYISVQQPSPGRILHIGKPNIFRAGIYSTPITTEEAEKSLERFVKLLSDGGCPSRSSSNIQSERWRKTVWNACWNVVCAVTGLDSLGVLESSEEAIKLVTDLSWEIVNTAISVLGVVDSEGNVKADLSDHLREYWSDPEELVKSNAEHPRASHTVTPSMLQDARKGLEMEVEALCGNILRHAQRLGLKTPVLRSLYVILVAMNNRFKSTKQ